MIGYEIEGDNGVLFAALEDEVRLVADR